MKKLFTISALTVAISAVASAGTISGTCTVNSGKTELGPTANGTITCTDFNLPTQILTSISLTITGSVLNSGSSLSTITLTNTGSLPQSATASTNSSFYLDSSTPLSGFTFTPDSNGALLTVSAPTGLQSLNGGQSKTINVSGTNSATSVDTTVFAPYTGAGSFSITADTLSGISSSGGGGNISTAQTTYAGITASVTYTYTAPSTTPEPATMTLFGSALLGIGFFARKRIAKK